MPAPKGHPPYNVKGEGGRPLEWTEDVIEEKAILFEEWIQLKDSMFIEDFRFENKIPPRKFYEFVKCNERFRNAYELFGDKQQSIIFKGGLSRKFAHPMCALLLSHKYNINQKNEQKITADETASFIFGKVNDTTSDLVNEPSPTNN